MNDGELYCGVYVGEIAEMAAHWLSSRIRRSTVLAVEPRLLNRTAGWPWVVAFPRLPHHRTSGSASGSSGWGFAA